jgi:hypothetical protein
LESLNLEQAMKPFKSLFEPQNPNRTSLQVVASTIGPSSQRLNLRLFNVIKDLAVIKSWLNDGDHVSNWDAKPSSTTILRYSNLLKKHRSQSFMILRDRIPVVQLDLALDSVPFSNDAFILSLEDATIGYLFVPNHRYPDIFIQSLELLLNYYATFTSTGIIYLKIPGNQTTIVKSAAVAGFTERALPIATDQNFFMQHNPKSY